MLKKIVVLIAVLIISGSVVFAGSNYSIKTMTAEVKEALDARKERFGELRALKTSGAIGENSRGYVEALKNESNAKAIASDENRDRQVIYKTIAEQNGLEGALATIETAFAQVQSDKASAGDQVQGADGSWMTK